MTSGGGREGGVDVPNWCKVSPHSLHRCRHTLVEKPSENKPFSWWRGTCANPAQTLSPNTHEYMYLYIPAPQCCRVEMMTHPDTFSVTLADAQSCREGILKAWQGHGEAVWRVDAKYFPPTWNMLICQTRRRYSAARRIALQTAVCRRRLTASSTALQWASATPYAGKVCVQPVGIHRWKFISHIYFFFALLWSEQRPVSRTQLSVDMHEPQRQCWKNIQARGRQH